VNSGRQWTLNVEVAVVQAVVELKWGRVQWCWWYVNSSILRDTIWSEKVRCSSKMKPMLRVEWVVLSLQLILQVAFSVIWAGIQSYWKMTSSNRKCTRFLFFCAAVQSCSTVCKTAECMHRTTRKLGHILQRRVQRVCRRPCAVAPSTNASHIGLSRRRPLRSALCPSPPSRLIPSLP